MKPRFLCRKIPAVRVYLDKNTTCDGIFPGGGGRSEILILNFNTNLGVGWENLRLATRRPEPAPPSINPANMVPPTNGYLQVCLPACSLPLSPTGGSFSLIEGVEEVTVAPPSWAMTRGVEENLPSKGSGWSPLCCCDGGLTLPRVHKQDTLHHQDRLTIL